MEFEVGKEYKTRGGSQARLLAYAEDGNRYERLAWVSDGRVYATNENGRLTYFKGDYDILPPEPEKVMVQKWLSHTGYVFQIVSGSDGETDAIGRGYTKLGQPYEVK